MLSPSRVLRCSKCGSSQSFLLETKEGKEVRVPRSITVDRIKKSVRVTCTYCNNRWDHIPVQLVDDLDELVHEPGLKH